MSNYKNRIILPVFFAALSVGSTFKTEAQKLELGLRFNPEFTGILNKNDKDAGAELDNMKHFTYLSFGVGAVYNLNKNMGLAIDVLFSREGQAFKGNFASAPPDERNYSSVVAKQLVLNDEVIAGDYEALAELNYIKLPIMLSLTTDHTRPLFFTMLVGPQLNLIEGVALEVDGEDLEFPNSDIEPKDLYKPITFNGVMAIGGGFNLSSRVVISTRFRFDYGFGDAEQKDLMVSYFNTAPVRFYAPDRKAAHNITEALMIGLDFKL